MKSIPKLIRRFVGLLLLSLVLLLITNILILGLISARQASNAHPWQMAREAAEALQRSDTGFILPDAILQSLQEQDAWAMLIAEGSGQVVWHTSDLPDAIPRSYTLAAIADLTRGYIDGYPAFTGGTEYGLLVLGYPRESFWKHMWPSWDYRLVAHAPQIALCVLGVNAALIFAIYCIANARLLRSVRPLTDGIRALPDGEPVRVPEKGLLSEVAQHINRTSDVLQSQRAQLRKTEAARANWIAGVSHDIRTPLSMVMGYAGQLADELSGEQQKKAAVILRQSERISGLISDLNLASRLEYNMQPLRLRTENAVALVRQAVVDFVNADLDGKYPVAWTTDAQLTSCPIQADAALIRRAVANLLQNCAQHNESGCAVTAGVRTEGDNCVIAIEDDGMGMTDEEIRLLNSALPDMQRVPDASGQQHGLGLLIVRRIALSHGGSMTAERSAQGGLCVAIRLPLFSGRQTPFPCSSDMHAV